MALAPLIDPNEHSCGTVRPHGARELAQDEPRLLLRRHEVLWPRADLSDDDGLRAGRSIAADIAGDREAAARVELVLPETGVCTRGGFEAAAPHQDAAVGRRQPRLTPVARPTKMQSRKANPAAVVYGRFLH